MILNFSHRSSPHTVVQQANSFVSIATFGWPGTALVADLPTFITDTLILNLPVNCVLDGQQDNMEEGFPKSRARRLDSLPEGMKSIFGE